MTWYCGYFQCLGETGGGIKIKKGKSKVRREYQEGETEERRVIERKGRGRNYKKKIIKTKKKGRRKKKKRKQIRKKKQMMMKKKNMKKIITMQRIRRNKDENLFEILRREGQSKKGVGALQTLSSGAEKRNVCLLMLCPSVSLYVARSHLYIHSSTQEQAKGIKIRIIFSLFQSFSENTILHRDRIKL